MAMARKPRRPSRAMLKERGAALGTDVGLQVNERVHCSTGPPPEARLGKRGGAP